MEELITKEIYKDFLKKYKFLNKNYIYYEGCCFDNSKKKLCELCILSNFININDFMNFKKKLNFKNINYLMMSYEQLDDLIIKRNIYRLNNKYSKKDLLEYLIKDDYLMRNRCNKLNHNLLEIAIQIGNLRFVKYLIEEYKMDIYKPLHSNNNWISLHLACYFGHLNIIKYLIDECKININYNLENESILLDYEDFETPFDICFSNLVIHKDKKFSIRFFVILNYFLDMDNIYLNNLKCKKYIDFFKSSKKYEVLLNKFIELKI